MKRISAQERDRFESLSARIGERTLRQLLTPEGGRLLRPERAANLLAGRGRMSESEASQLAKISRNSNAITRLKDRGEAKGLQDYKINRAIRAWIDNGKQKGVPYKDQSEAERNRQMKAIKSLAFLGVNPSDGIFYVRE